MQGKITSPFGAGLKDRDLCVAVDPLIDACETGRRGDLDLGVLLDDAERVRLEPAAFDKRAKRRSGEALAVRRIEKGERKRAAGGGAPSLVASARQIRVTPPSAIASTLARRSARASAPLSTNSAKRPPRERASIASAPVPANRSTTRAPSMWPGNGVEDVEDQLAQALRSRDGWRATTALRARGP